MLELLVRVVVDTNVWISALVNPDGAPARLLNAVLAGRVRLILSRPLISEIQRVVRRERIRRRIALSDVELDRYFAAMSKGSVVVSIDGNLRLCRDPKDDPSLETAIVGGAHYIVSRDEDLTRDLALVDTMRAHSIEILTVARFLELLDTRKS